MNDDHNRQHTVDNLAAATDSTPAAALDYDGAVEQFYEPLYRFAFGLTGIESDAADLTQETYRALLVKGGQIRDHLKIKSWLFTTLYRKFLGQRRRFSRFPEVQVETVERDLPASDPDLETSLDANEAVRALQTLDEKYRVPLVLFYLQEFSYREIATTLSIPVGTIMSRLARGKEILRRKLENAGLGEFLRPRVQFAGTSGNKATASETRLNVARWHTGAIAPCY